MVDDGLKRSLNNIFWNYFEITKHPHELIQIKETHLCIPAKAKYNLVDEVFKYKILVIICSCELNILKKG